MLRKVDHRNRAAGGSAGAVEGELGQTKRQREVWAEPVQAGRTDRSVDGIIRRRAVLQPDQRGIDAGCGHADIRTRQADHERSVVDSQREARHGLGAATRQIHVEVRHPGERERAGQLREIAKAEVGADRNIRQAEIIEAQEFAQRFGRSRADLVEAKRIQPERERPRDQLDLVGRLDDFEVGRTVAESDQAIRIGELTRDRTEGQDIERIANRRQKIVEQGNRQPAV